MAADGALSRRAAQVPVEPGQEEYGGADHGDAEYG
jgi:hypothetical protein